MILVVLGTFELPFTRMLEEVERLKKQGEITDEIVVQVGHTPFKSDVMELRPFMSYEDMEKLYDQADLVITHGGTGSIITGVKKSKKVIAIARLQKYGEHNDDHQIEIVEQFTNTGHILNWKEGQPLLDVLNEVEAFEPTPFQSGRERILNILEDFIGQ